MKNLIANIYEFWGGAYLGEFSNTMFDNDLYFSIALYSILTALAIVVLYYYVIDRPSTAKIGIWLLALLTGLVASFIIAFVSARNGLAEIFATIGQPIPLGYDASMLQFALINGALTVALMLVLSLILKWKSPHSSYVPF